jgi:acyl-CoA reductase-like NAD-dependent aldehyde dehydrogenase
MSFASTEVRHGRPVRGEAQVLDVRHRPSRRVITADQPLTILGAGTAVIRRGPLGVLLGIMPWNFPYYPVTITGLSGAYQRVVTVTLTVT